MLATAALTRSLLLGSLTVVAVAGCSTSSPTPAQPTATPTAVPDDAGCKGVADPTRVVVKPGNSAPFGAAAIGVDEGGGFAITIRGKATTWAPAKGDLDRFVVVGDLCIRAIDRSTLDVADRPGATPAEAKPEMPRCTIQCCATEEARKPAPDGTVECCFCDD